MPAAAIAGAAVVSAGASIISGNKAAKAAQQAADKTVAENRRQYDQDRADLAPYRETGTLALDKLSSMYGVQRAGGTYAPPTGVDGIAAQYGGFQTSPGYEFRRDEGIKAVERGASARGLLASGAGVKATARFADGLASSEYNNFADRLASLAGVGQTSTNATVQAGQASTANISNAYTNAGNARSSAYLNTGAAISKGVQNLATIYAFNAGGGFKIPKVGG